MLSVRLLCRLVSELVSARLCSERMRWSTRHASRLPRPQRLTQTSTLLRARWRPSRPGRCTRGPTRECERRRRAHPPRVLETLCRWSPHRSSQRQRAIGHRRACLVYGPASIPAAPLPPCLCEGTAGCAHSALALSGLSPWRMLSRADGRVPDQRHAGDRPARVTVRLCCTTCTR